MPINSIPYHMLSTARKRCISEFSKCKIDIREETKSFIRQKLPVQYVCENQANNGAEYIDFYIAPADKRIKTELYMTVQLKKADWTTLTYRNQYIYTKNPKISWTWNNRMPDEYPTSEAEDEFIKSVMTKDFITGLREIALKYISRLHKLDERCEYLMNIESQWISECQSITNFLEDLIMVRQIEEAGQTAYISVMEIPDIEKLKEYQKKLVLRCDGKLYMRDRTMLAGYNGASTVFDHLPKNRELQCNKKPPFIEAGRLIMPDGNPFNKCTVETVRKMNLTRHLTDFKLLRQL